MNHHESYLQDYSTNDKIEMVTNKEIIIYKNGYPFKCYRIKESKILSKQEIINLDNLLMKYAKYEVPLENIKNSLNSQKTNINRYSTINNDTNQRPVLKTITKNEKFYKKDLPRFVKKKVFRQSLQNNQEKSFTQKSLLQDNIKKNDTNVNNYHLIYRQKISEMQSQPQNILKIEDYNNSIKYKEEEKKINQTQRRPQTLRKNLNQNQSQSLAQLSIKQNFITERNYKNIKESIKDEDKNKIYTNKSEKKENLLLIENPNNRQRIPNKINKNNSYLIDNSTFLKRDSLTRVKTEVFKGGILINEKIREMFKGRFSTEYSFSPDSTEYKKYVRYTKEKNNDNKNNYAIYTNYKQNKYERKIKDKDIINIKNKKDKEKNKNSVLVKKEIKREKEKEIKNGIKNEMSLHSYSSNNHDNETRSTLPSYGFKSSNENIKTEDNKDSKKKIFLINKTNYFHYNGENCSSTFNYKCQEVNDKQIKVSYCRSTKEQNCHFRGVLGYKNNYYK